MVDGQTSYHGRTLWAADIPFGLKSRLTCHTKPAPSSSIRRGPSADRPILRLLSWNASRYLNYQEWLSWCVDRQEDVILVQWSMTGQWQIDCWYCIHSHSTSAILLIIIRRTLIQSSLLAYNDIIPGRLIHVRLIFHQIHDIYAIYQTVWNIIRPVLQARQDLWHKLTQGIHRIPKSYILIIVDDFNTPLDKALPSIGSRDPRYSKVLRINKQVFQNSLETY